MQRTLRSIGILIAALFFCLSLNSAHAATTVVTKTIPLPRGCNGIKSVANVNGTAPVCCGFGYVYDGATGQPLVDEVEVTLQSEYKTIPAMTSSGDLTEASYFSANLSAGLEVEPGDTITLTATYNGVTAMMHYQVDGGGQQIDLVLPTAPDDQAPIATFNYMHENALDEGAPQEITLASIGADRDNIGTTAPTAYQWTSNIDGLLSEDAQFTLDLDELSPGNHNISVKVQDDEGNWSEEVTRPLSHMVYDLSIGWNTLNLAGLPHDVNDIHMLMNAVQEQGGCPEEAAWWNGDNWSTAIHGVTLGYSDLIPETPYFLRTSCDSQLTLLSRESLQAVPEIALSIGWTFVTYPHAAQPIPSDAVCQQIDQQGGEAQEVVRWNTDSGNWAIYSCGMPFGKFLLEAGSDYFIRNQIDSTWKPEPVITAAQVAPQAVTEERTLSEIQNISLITPKPQITDIRVTNRRDTTISVSWLTDLLANSQVWYGTDQNNLLNQAEDDRGAPYQGTTHHVTLRNLVPETTYYYKVQSKNRVADNNGQLYSFTTGPTIGIASLDPVYGEVKEKDGRVSATDGIVYLRVLDNNGTGNGKSGWMSALISNGYWVSVDQTAMNIGAARTESGQSYFNYSASGDQLELQATLGSACNKTIIVDTENDRPAKAITLPCMTRPLYVSSTTNGNANGLALRDEDILLFHPGTNQWLLYFDGSDVGLGSKDVNAFHLLANGDILMSFNSSVKLGSLKIDDSDIVRFRPTSLGTRTRGSFKLYFDGSDVGLTTSQEDVDAIGFDLEGNLVISMLGNYNVPKTGGGKLKGGDEDLLVFAKTRLGSNTKGTWSRYFDGSDLELKANSEDIAAVWIDPANGDVHLSTLGNYAAKGNFKGDSDNIFSCVPGTLGNKTQCELHLVWNGDTQSFGKESIDGYAMAPVDDDAIVIGAGLSDGGEWVTIVGTDDVEVDDTLDDDVDDAYLSYLPVISR